MRIVVALGGNALSPRGMDLTMAHQREAMRAASSVLADVAAEHQLVITHGNGPQIGLLALQVVAYDAESDLTLDVLDAESAGMVGYVIEQELGNRLPAGREVVTVLTTTLVDRDDPAFAEPTKFVGPVYDSETARRLEHYRRWTIRPDGMWYRRVVPSPHPVAVAPLGPIGVLLDLGYVVVCGGGGGVPVCAGPYGMEGVEAVVDKDAVSALIAEELDADLLVIATDVPHVYEGWGTADAHPLRLLDVVDLDPTTLQSGSMRPKVEAAARFARSGGRAMIGALSDLQDLVAGTAGTQVVDSHATGGGQEGSRRGSGPSALSAGHRAS
ncbi:MAG TPA: carbamate kinase [Nocardioides sp.]|uniref:carbamate kinase n=1 Tax=uncultured Nocardioides sp. TaxID=198441 RepID=UPI000EEE954C|nr:carbamate kinase [uncultured Nocardioides sp.]HCB06714.1 carbamate kinase [Nocardioides sp.]HRD59851.1 carbamate kinase [Nocardioides sp.]HRI96419.1 carbamate kinase [Nocardioides sp.]HRK46382.1 carbamate kinase [Nocardioides sp.]